MRRAKDLAAICTMTRAEYDAITDRVNWSTLKHILTSPKHYQHHLTTPKEDADRMALGRAVATAVFEPERLCTDYATWGGGRRFGKEWDAFRAAHAGQDIITLDQALGASTVAASVRSHPVARKLLANRKGAGEVTLLWTDPETGIRCKGRPDWLTPRIAMDLKSTHDIEARHFGRTFGDLLSHGQIGFYNLGLEANGRRVKWKVVAVEQKPPFDVAVYNVSADDLWAGEEAAREALRTLSECRRAHRWPGRYEKALPLSLPPWCYPAAMEEERRELMRMEGLL